jgi:transcription initiation factor IIE alpha subunit
MNGLEGICPKCGHRYYGWALNIQSNQLCVKCGSALEIRKDGVLVRPRLPTLRAEEYERVSRLADN